MGRIPKDGVRRYVNVTFNHEQAVRLNAWREAAGIPDMPSAVRACVEIALAFNPDDGFRSAAVDRAFNGVRRFAQTRLAEFLVELAEQIKLSVPTVEGEE